MQRVKMAGHVLSYDSPRWGETGFDGDFEAWYNRVSAIVFALAGELRSAASGLNVDSGAVFVTPRHAEPR